jgi:pyruvate/2-oxoglutarate dehydrogenase complex dihydrolipoamide dehydrogenase (E3) component
MYDLVVIGGGSGGLHAARLAAQVGARVALIERARPGGARRSGACVPSKGLVQAARLVRQIREAGSFGIKTETPRVDFAAVLERIRAVGEQTAAGDSDEALKSQGIDVLHGVASFSAYDTVLLDGRRRVEGQRFLIATGSRPGHPAIPGLREAGCLESSNLWALAQIPESLTVLGGGAYALEFAQVFARFGSKVTVLTGDDRVLPGEDPEVGGQVACMLTGEGVAIRRLAEVEKVEVRGDQKVCIGRDRQSGERFEVASAAILYSGNRLANVEDLNLEAVGVHGDPEHGIEVDDLLQTHAVRVYAVGDVLLRNQYAHVAEREAEVAFQNAVLRRRQKMDYGNLPRATFLDPEVASVGISEAHARAENLDHRVFRASYADLDRARIEGRTQGFAKVITSGSGKILGATILGEDASLVLGQLVVAMDGGLGLADLAETTQVYPTYGRLVRDLAVQARATRLERGFRAAALKFLYGFQPRGGDGPSPDAGEASAQAEADAQAPATGHGH